MDKTLKRPLSELVLVPSCQMDTQRRFIVALKAAHLLSLVGIYFHVLLRWCCKRSPAVNLQTRYSSCIETVNLAALYKWAEWQGSPWMSLKIMEFHNVNKHLQYCVGILFLFRIHTR